MIQEVPLQNHHTNRYENIFYGTIVVSVLLMLLGVILDDPANILPGLYRIVSMQDLLITDYVQIAGVGASLINCGLVTIISILLIKLSKDPINGFTLVEMGLMAGFSLFGKNIFNIWPIILGTYLYARYQKEPFSKYASVALLATALSPLVSYMALGSIHASLPLGLLVGILVGFILPSLTAYTYKIQNGMNLYNTGFACCLFSMMVVPILTAIGDQPDTAMYWATNYNRTFSIVLAVLCGAFIVTGLFFNKSPVWAVWAGYRRLLSTTGRVPSDYLRMFGTGPVLVNMGVNGLLGMAYIFIVGGELNGPTLGAIFTIIGFSAFGKHALNIIPVMVGVALGAYGMRSTPNAPTLQLAGLFGTTLAPIAGHFGWPFGVLAGFIHSALVLQTSGPVAGLNLYNNGFSGGLIAIVLYPTLTAIVRHRRPHLRDEDFYDLFEASEPIDTSVWRTHRKDAPHDEPLLTPQHGHGVFVDTLPEDEDDDSWGEHSHLMDRPHAPPHEADGTHPQEDSRTE